MPEDERHRTSKDYLLAASAKLSGHELLPAFSICALGLESFPDDVGLLCLAGRCCIGLNKLDEAQRYAQAAQMQGPADARAHEIQGDVMLAMARPGEAVKAYRQIEKLDPARDIADRMMRARAMMAGNRPEDGKRGERLRFQREMAEAGRHERDGEPGKAEDIYRKILRSEPDHVEAMRLLAATAVKHGKRSDAEVFLRRAVTVAPDYARAWLDLSLVQLDQDKFEEAVTSAQALVRLTPTVADSHLAVGNALARVGNAKEAAAAYREALECSPGHTGALSGLAQQLKTIGLQDEAVATHRENIARNPTEAEPWWSLANLKTFQFSEDDLSNMASLLENATLEDQSRVQLCNALGLGWEGKKDYDRAFRYFERGNTLRRTVETYDPVENEVITDRLIDVFNEQFLSKNAGHGDPDSSPIFIVGLPRSGSTLIEQILASHSQVEGTHELSELPRLVRSLPRAKTQDRFPENLPGLQNQLWARFGQRYLESVERYRSGSPRFIDKNPNNFIYVGLLALILPGAKIINARRHPMDSCFGTYKQLFAQGQPFSYDLTEIGEYYLQYQRQMNHWHEVLPGKVLDIQYEDVVADLDGQVRRLLAFCDLPFEPQCLSFWETERAVKTASSEQVRTPLYSSSVNLWRRYEGHLDELQEILAPLLPEN